MELMAKIGKRNSIEKQLLKTKSNLTPKTDKCEHVTVRISKLLFTF